MTPPQNIIIIEADRAAAAALESRLREAGCEWAPSVPKPEDALRNRTAITPELIVMSVAAGEEQAALKDARQLRQSLACPVVFYAEPAVLSVLQQGGEVGPCSTLRRPVESRELALVLEANQRISTLEGRLRQLEVKMQEAQRLEGLGVMAGGVAHDFNNLLTGIYGGVALAKEEIPASSPAMARLDQVERAANRAAELCQRLLAHAGRGSAGARLLDVEGLVNDAVRLAKTSLKPDISIQTGAAAKLPPVRGEEAPLRQVLTNLLSNAAEAIGDAPGMIRVVAFTRQLDRPALAQLQFSGEAQPGEFVAIEVADTGCGMDADTLPRIFDPVFTTKAAGRGLGLAAAARIVRKHRGGISVESAPRQGAVFRVFLPVASDDQARTAVQEAPKVASVAAVGGTILVVDDDDAVRALAKWVVERAGYRVVDARDGNEALRAFKTDPGAFRLVLLDLTMPRMGGAEVLVGLRALRPNIPVVIITGHGEDALEDAETKGVVGFLQKPFAPETLRAILSRHVPLAPAGQG